MQCREGQQFTLQLVPSRLRLGCGLGLGWVRLDSFFGFQVDSDCALDSGSVLSPTRFALQVPNRFRLGFGLGPGLRSHFSPSPAVIQTGSPLRHRFPWRTWSVMLHPTSFPGSFISRPGAVRWKSLGTSLMLHQRALPRTFDLLRVSRFSNHFSAHKNWSGKEKFVLWIVILFATQSKIEPGLPVHIVKWSTRQLWKVKFFMLGNAITPKFKNYILPTFLKRNVLVR